MRSEVKHTVFDPRQIVVGGAGFFDVPAHTRSAPPSRRGRSSLSMQGASTLKPIPESGSECAMAMSKNGESQLVGSVGSEPWRSAAVAEFAVGLQQGNLEALILQGPRGTALRAAGEGIDHQVASKAVADIETRRQKVSMSGPAVDLAELKTFRRNAVPRTEDLVLARPSEHLRQDMSFGAVYEYRDACGTAKVVGSTATMPEKQFALDQRHYEHTLPKQNDPKIVWVGISGGRLDLAQTKTAKRGSTKNMMSWLVPDILAFLNKSWYM